MDNQENSVQDVSFRPSEFSEPRSPDHPVNNRDLNLDDSVVVYENCTGEEHHNMANHFCDKVVPDESSIV